MLHWVLGLPWPVLGLLIVLSFVAAGLVGLSIFRAFILPRLGPVPHQNEVTGSILHGILVIYGLAVALIAIAVWEAYAEVSKLVSAEATAIAALYRDTWGYPEPTRTRLRDGIRAYTDDLIHVAWPLMREGKIPTQGVVLMDRVQDILFNFNPETDAQKLIHAETLRAYNALVEARRLRLDVVHTGLEAPMWAIVLIGASIALSASFFFDIQSVAIHRIMVALLAALMGLVVFLIVIYDHPFRGTHSVSPEAYELIYRHLMQP